jgi:putative effector of murein hydrolase
VRSRTKLAARARGDALWARGHAIGLSHIWGLTDATAMAALSVVVVGLFAVTLSVRFARGTIR